MRRESSVLRRVVCSAGWGRTALPNDLISKTPEDRGIKTGSMEINAEKDKR